MAGGYYRAPYPAGVGERAKTSSPRSSSPTPGQRWGAFGEIGTSIEGIHPDERKMLRAISKAHLRRALPIFTHTDHRGCAHCALDQLDAFESAGVNRERSASAI